MNESNFFALYSMLLIWLVYFLTSSCTRNWQEIEVHIAEIVPRYLVVEENSTFNLYCGSNSSALHWTFKARSLDVWNTSTRPISSKHSIGLKQLTLNNIKYDEDNGDYYCNWRSPQGQLFQGYSRVSVVNKRNLELYQNKHLGQISPNFTEVSSNTTVTLTCYSSTPVEWFSIHLAKLKIETGANSLTLLNIQNEHSGEHLCRGSYATYGHIFHARALVYVDGTVTRKNEMAPEFRAAVD